MQAIEIHLLCDPQVRHPGLSHEAARERRLQDLSDETWLEIGAGASRWTVRPLTKREIEDASVRAATAARAPTDYGALISLEYCRAGSRLVVDLDADDEVVLEPQEILELADYVRALTAGEGLGVPLGA